ncbi:MAG: Gfo/Idh/MocA family protein [Phycisphaerales bacterium]
MNRLIAAFVACVFVCVPSVLRAEEEVEPLRIAVIGLVHGHVEGVLWQAKDRDDLQIVGIYDPDPALFTKYKDKYQLDESWYFDDLDEMLDATDPEAASVMTSIKDHIDAVRACAVRGVHTLVEKPLAINAVDAMEMKMLSVKHDVHVLTNYETSWYASVRTAAKLAKDSGGVTRAVFRHGHKGPREIGCSEEFLQWLTDPEENGGGAIVDFGCYGANLMTWIMDNQMPDTVTAITRQLKPEIYPEVDDDATIVLGYKDSVAVIQASWAWTHDNKDMDLFTPGASYHAQKWDSLAVRDPDGAMKKRDVFSRSDEQRNEWTYLRKVIRDECEIDPLSSIDNNLIVCVILDAARESAKTGKTVRFEGITRVAN